MVSVQARAAHGQGRSVTIRPLFTRRVCLSALIECIANVSEGRRDDVVEELQKAALAAAPGVLLLDSPSDRDHTRSVFTFLGDGPPLVAAMEALVEAALQRIDMRTHQGAHPRLGAVDVIPFVPI